MNKSDKAPKILSTADIILCSFTLIVSFIFPIFVNNPNFRILFSSGFMYWTVIIATALSLIAIALFAVVLIIRSIYNKKIIINKRTILTCIVNVIFIASLIFFIYDNDLGFIFV